MAFYIYEHPAFYMEKFHSGFHQPFQSARVPRYLDMIENLLEQNSMSFGSNQKCCAIKSEKESEQKSSNSTTEENKNMEVSSENKTMVPVVKTVSKSFMSKVTSQEDMEKVNIKVILCGHKFQPENLDVQVINDDVLVVKAEDDVEKFERKFKLPNNVLFDQIESKFDTKEENEQTLTINIPKDVKKFQVPISMEE